MPEVILIMKMHGGTISFFLHHADTHQPIIPNQGGIFLPPPGITLIQAHWVKRGKK